MKTIILFLSLLFISFTWAQTSYQTDVLSSLTQSNDLMPATGKFKGHKIENKEKRTLIRLTSMQKSAFSIPSDALAFGNFLHKGEFYIAYLPTMKVRDDQGVQLLHPTVKKVEFVQKQWAAQIRPETKSLETHAEMTLELLPKSSMVLVYNQNTKKSVSLKIDKIIFSIEVARSEKALDAPFFPEAFLGNLAVVHRLYSYYEKQNRSDNHESTYVINKLDFSDTKAFHPKVQRSEDYLLFKAIETSHLYGRNQTYDAFLNNCTNRLFDLLDQSMGYNQSKTKKIDFSKIEEDYVDWVNEDLTQVLDLLKGHISKNNIKVPQELSLKIEKMSQDLVLNKIDDMKKSWSHEQDMRHFLYGLPSFIEGHLKARGLIK